MAEVKEFILRQFDTGRPRLAQLKSDIAEKFDFDLKYSDLSFVDQNFIQIVLDLWRIEVKAIIELALETDDLIDGEMVKMFMAFEENGFKGVPKNFMNDTYELIVSDFEVFQEQDFLAVCDKILSFWNYAIRTKTRTLIREFEFFDSLLAVLRNSYKQFPDVVEAFQLEIFSNGEISLKELADVIADGKFDIEGFEKLHLAAIKLPDKKLSLGMKIQQSIKEYLLPARITTEFILGKMTTTILKKLMTMEVLDFQPMSDVEEVDLICDVFHIDESLPEQFRGKSIAILSNHVIIHEEAHWNLSGADQDHKYTSPAGQSATGQGLDGDNGRPGESGGHFAVFCQSIKNPSKWTIRSSGGKASSGQDAGDGIDGKNGRNVERNDFSVNGTEYRIDFGIVSLKRRLKKIGLKYTQSDAIFVPESGMHKSVYFYRSFWKPIGLMQVKGSKGAFGQSGGVGGYAAEGGYPGDLSIETAADQTEALVQKVGIQGEHSEVGKSGYNGLNGIDGSDGWMWDHALRTKICEGLEASDKYSIADGKTRRSAWYHEKNGHVHSAWSGSINQIQNERQRNNSTENQSQKVAAVKQSQILMTSIRKLHSAYLQSELETLSKLFEKFEAYEGITEETSVSTDVRTSHQLQYTEETKPPQEDDTDDKVENPVDFEEIAELFETEKSSTEIFEALRRCEMSKEECLEVLYSSQPRFEADPKPTEDAIDSILKYEPCFISNYVSTMKEDFKISFTDVVKLSNEKLKLKYFEDISAKIFVSDTRPPPAEIKPLINVMDNLPFLVESQEKFASGIRNGFGNLDSFINDNDDYHAELVVNSFKYSASTVLPNKFSYFEVIFQVLYDEFSGESYSFDDCKKQLAILKKIDREVPDSAKDDDPRVLELEVAFKKMWDDFFTKVEVMSLITERLANEKIKSSTYRFLLASQFEINWIIFVRDVDGNLSLKENINGNLTSTTIYSIQRDDKFSILQFDAILFELRRARKWISRKCKYVLNTSVGLLNNDQMLEYFENDKYLQEGDKILELYDEKLLERELLVSRVMSYFSSMTSQGKIDIEMLLLNVATVHPNSNNILKAMNVRFFDEGRLVTANELSTVLTIISNCILDRNMVDYLEFLLLSSKQREWLPEMIVLQAETYLKCISAATKESWLKLLKEMEHTQFMVIFSMKIEVEETPMTETDFDEILNVMGNFSLSSIENLLQTDLLLWKFTLTEQFWTNQLETMRQSEELRKNTHADAKLYLISMQSKFGSEKTQALASILTNKGEELYNFNMINFLINFDVGNWNLCDPVFELLENTPVDMFIAALEEHYFSDPDQRSIDQICKLVDESSETSPAMKERLDLVKREAMEVHSLVCPKQKIRFLDFTEEHVLDWIKEHKSRPEPAPVTECLAIVTRTIQLKTAEPIMLRHVQIFSVLSLWHSLEGALIQVGTGEGKSFIGLAFSLLKVLHKQKVDIITSSPILAERDADDEVNKSIVGFLGFTVNHNCVENKDQRKQVYAESDIIYGSLSYFQRDYLLTEFYNEDFMSTRRRDNVLVDEVDSMLLDKGNNILYLSQGLPDIDEIESVFVHIWQWVNQNADTNEEMVEILKTETVRKVVLDQIFGLITEDDITGMLPKGYQAEAPKIFQELVKSRLLDEEGIVQMKTFDASAIKATLPVESNLPKPFIDRIEYYFREKIEKEKSVKIPTYLQSFVMLHLTKWIESAVRALFMENEKQYIIDRSKTGTIADREPNVIILDLSTGVDQVNSQWDEGLHQFLQLKHGCKLTLISLKSVFISNVSYFKLYTKLYGMTGTLGSLQERQKLTEVHDLDYMTVPTYIPKKFTEKEAIIVEDTDGWFNAIKNEIIDIFNEKRSCLIICETITDIKNIRKFITSDDEGLFGAENVHSYQRDYEKFDVGKLPPRHVIIATNLAGRGTDIKLSNDLKSAGGLHVILTYLPSNVRTELQAFGRAARAGAMGSARLIVVSEKLLPITDLKFQRDEIELQRLNEIAMFYKQFIKIEEKFFGQFQLTYRNFAKTGDKESIILENFLIQWSFWLDRNSRYLEDWKTHGSQEKAEKSFEKFLLDFNSESLEFHPSLTIKMFKHMDENKKTDEARDFLLANFNESSVVFHYYKLYIELKLRKNNKTLTSGEERLLRKGIQAFDSHAFDRLVRKLGMDPYIERHKTTLVPIDGLEKQNDTLKMLEEHYVDSINDILGKAIYPETFESPLLNSKMLQKEFFDHISKNDVIDLPCVSNFYDDSTIKKLAETYMLDTDALSKFLKDSKREGPINSIDDFVEKIRINKSFWMPSREDFWDILRRSEILASETSFIVVDMDALKDFDPSECESLLNLTSNHKILQPRYSGNPDNNFDIFLYSVSEDNEALTESTSKVLFEKNEIDFYFVNEKKVKIQMFHEQKIFNEHKRAIFNKDEFTRPKSFNVNGFRSKVVEDFKVFGDNGQTIADRLVEQEILVPAGADFFHLNAKNFDNIDLAENSVYQGQVIEILSNKFAYTIALEKLKLEIKSRNEDIVISLTSNTHLSFVLDLITNGVLEPSKANNSKNGKLKNLYGSEFSENGIFDLMRDRVPKSMLTTALISELVDKDILLLKNQAPFDPPVNYQPTYKIKKFDSEEKALGKNFKPSEATIKLILQNRKTIIEKEENLLDKLEQHVKALQRFDQAQFFLKSIDEFEKDLITSEELYVLKLKGMDGVIQVQEKKFSKSFWMRFFMIIIIGLVQIAIGVAINVLTLGLAMNIGNMFIDEGFGDIVFALVQLRTSHFSWKDYGKHKKDSIIKTVILIAFSFCASKIKFLKNFFKSQPILGSAAKLTKKAALKQVAYTLLKKGVESLSKVAVQMGAEYIVESLLPGLTSKISTFLSDAFQKNFWEHEIQTTIDGLLRYCTPADLERIIDSKIDAFFKKIEHGINMVGKVKDYIDIVIGSGKNISKWISTTTKVIGNSSVVIAMGVYIITSLDEINDALLDELRVRSQTSEERSVTEEESEELKQNVFGELQKRLSEQLNGVLNKNIVLPLLQEAGNQMSSKIQQGVAGTFTYVKSITDKFSSKIVVERMLTILKLLSKNFTRNQILRKMYLETKVQRNLSRTASPELFSMLCQIDVPMNSFGVEATTQYLQKRDMNIQIVVTSDSVKTIFGKEDGTTVQLTLKDGDFQNSNQRRFGYDCFYHSLDDHIPGFSREVSPEEFRNGIAELFMKSSELRKTMANRSSTQTITSVQVDVSKPESQTYSPGHKRGNGHNI